MAGPGACDDYAKDFGYMDYEADRCRRCGYLESDHRGAGSVTSDPAPTCGIRGCLEHAVWPETTP